VGFTALSVFAGELAGKKVVIIDSYHQGYPWSDGIVQGAQKILALGGATVKVIHMDTKNNPAEEFKKQSAVKAVAEITEFKPDAIIAADDNASKYVIVPTYKDKEIPVVFCGLNWDATAYGFPCKNVTGMLEVSSFDLLSEKIKTYSKGTKIGYLGISNETSRKEAENTEKNYSLTFEKRFVTTFEEWKKMFVELQGISDWVLVESNAGISGWDDAVAQQFVIANTKVPTGSIYDFMVDYVLISLAKSAEEQGEWAAAAATKILKGTSVAQIPIVKNKKGEVFLNLKIAQKLGINFDLNLVKIAKKVVK
jgi:ABC-type uncharacterized transport system substrate-binding protein